MSRRFPNIKRQDESGGSNILIDVGVYYSSQQRL